MRTLAGLFSLLLLSLATCGAPAPYVRYSGTTMAHPTPTAQIRVYRSRSPERAYDEMGTIRVTCPTQDYILPGAVWVAGQEGGCNYDWAVSKAAEQAAKVGADGIYGVSSTNNGNGSVITLTATAFRYLPIPPMPIPKKTTPAAASTMPDLLPPPVEASPQAGKTTEDRLRQLKSLRDQGLITEDEYKARKAKILERL